MAGVNTAWAKVIYLKPNSNWLTKDNDKTPRFAARCWEGADEFWYEMCDGNGDNIYTAIVDDKYTNVIFCRINPNTNDNSWGTTWNQTSDLKIDGNLYTVAEGAWSYGTGSWSSANYTKAMYFQPNSNWISDNARFAVYCFNGNSNGWLSMNLHIASCDLPYYKCDVPVDYKEVIFGRMKPGSTNGWNTETQIWNRTKNLTILSGQDCFVIKDGDWGLENAGADGQWSTYATPSYTVTLIADSHGTYNVTYGDTIVPSKLDANVEVTVPFDTKITITSNTPKAGYAQTHGARIKIGNQEYQNATLGTPYTICGNTTITGNYVSKAEQKVYLQPTTIWATKDAVEAYRAYVFHDSGNEWLDATAVSITLTDGNTYSSGDNVQEYELTIPAGYHSIIFCRVNSKGTDNDPWKNVWNQTNDLLIPVGQPTNCCKITKMGEKPTPESEPENCESVWKLRTFDVNVYSSTFGEYGFVYDNVKHYAPSSEYTTYEVPQGASIKIFSTPYNDTYRGDVMTNVGGVRTETTPSSPNLTISAPTNIDDNFKTTTEHVVYLAIPNNKGTWVSTTNKDNYVYAFHSRTEANRGAVVAMGTEVGRANVKLDSNDVEHIYYRCVVPAGYNTIRFEKRSAAGSFNGTIDPKDLQSVDLKYQIPLNSVNCYRLDRRITDAGSDKDKFAGVWEQAPGFDGDYRLVYKKSATVVYPSDIVRNGTESQTVSLHINPVNANNEYPKLELQKYVDAAWVTQSTQLVKDIAVITNDSYEQGRGVWNFVVKKNGSSMAVDYNAAERYTGNYYIRTNNAEGGWRFYTLSTNKMTYSSYAKAHSGYTHYYCRWVGIVDNSTMPGKSNNVKFIVANEYGAVISNELAKDAYTEEGGILPENANVRWTWDERTNEVKRAYILGSDKDHLMLTYKPDSNATTITKKLADKENWIYEIELENIQAGSKVESLAAKYPSTPKDTQYFISDKPMITSDYGTSHKVRVMYDFKTNQTSVMLIPDNQANIGIDVLIERENQGDATQVTSPINAASQEEGYTVYAAMTFKKEHIMSETATEWERLYYWVSFPFNVRISDVFGFGEYGKQWVIQYYNGALRAKNGYQSEDQTFWRYINPKDTVYNPNKALEDANGNPCNGVMVANRGYILALAKSIAQQGIFQNNNDHVRLYFPSMEKIQSIDDNMQNVTAILKPYTCTISGREEYDSHWHVIGAPSYANKNVAVTQDDLFFYYKYDAKTNTYEVQETNSVEFKSMHSYMVQYAGNINWSANTTFVPQQIAASRNADYEPQLCHLGLLLMQDGKTLDQTFIRMQEDNATADYDMNLDLTKIINSGANIYSLAGDKQIELAGNVLPTDDTTIPLGVLIRQTGDYTFSMPAGTDGAVVELIDYETNTRTNLLLSDYTVNIPTGTHTNRFALRVEQSKTATGIESPADNAAGVNKYIINGQLIIVRDGATYNTIGQQL